MGTTERSAAFGGPAAERIVIWPSRALSRAGSCLLPGAIGAVFAVIALWAGRIGAWPVAIYAALAGGGFALAIACNNRSGRLQQVIEFGPDLIVVRTRGPASSRRSHSEDAVFNPYWVRLVERTDQHNESCFALEQSGRRVAIGEFLGADERGQLALALREKLATYRRGASG